MAGTIDSATLAVNDLHEKYPDFVITIVDSHCASLGFGLLTYKLLKMQENGAPKELIIEAAKAYAGHIPHVFTVETLKYLVKGGRVSKTSGYVGEALDIKPILVIEEDGVIQPKMKVRGRKKSLRALLDYVGEHGVNLENQIVGVVHANDPATCDLLISELNKRYHPKEIISGCMGCAIGAHVGQGAVGIVCVDFDDSKYAEYQGVGK